MTIKTLIIAAAAAATTFASAASADSYFGSQINLQPSDRLEVGLVTSEGAGVLEIYDYRLGTQGKLLGSEQVFAGANPDVRVQTGLTTNDDVLAVLKVDGEVVATKRFLIN